MREPTWNRDELVLVLDLYFRTERPRLNQRNPQVVEMSALLRSLPIHPAEARTIAFRSAMSVKSKLENFYAIEHPGHGLRRGGRLDGEVFAEFAGQRGRLAELAAMIRSASELLGSTGAKGTEWEIDDEGAIEGVLVMRLHKMRERNPGLARKAKERMSARLDGRWECEACRADLTVLYGAVAESIIECHHTKPLSAAAGPRKTRLSELALLCPNCHRAIHRMRPMPTIAEFRAELERRLAPERI
ncbi:MAG: HNH endonuclease [Candidatus Didemnitutus sp.]|nr:HNH endonuclease [Candidatus Didemnitutus sp.]